MVNVACVRSSSIEKWHLEQTYWSKWLKVTFVWSYFPFNFPFQVVSIHIHFGVSTESIESSKNKCVFHYRLNCMDFKMNRFCFCFFFSQSKRICLRKHLDMVYAFQKPVKKKKVNWIYVLHLKDQKRRFWCMHHSKIEFM